MQASKKDKKSGAGDEFAGAGKKRKNLQKQIMNTFGGKDQKNADYGSGFYQNISNPNTNTHINGLNYDRMMPEITSNGGSFGSEKSDEEIMEMYQGLMAPHKKNQDGPQAPTQEETNANFDKSMMTLKDMQYNQLKRLQKTYGTLGSQMHPEDFMKKYGKNFNKNTQFMQDTFQMLDNGGQKYFDFENSKKDQEYKKLVSYFGKVVIRMKQYEKAKSFEDELKGNAKEDEDLQTQINDQYANIPLMDQLTDEDEAGIGGPSMNAKEQAEYMSGLQKKFKNKKNRLFGKFAGQ